MATNYVIVGGGGFAREVACWALDVCNRSPSFTVRGFVDDDAALATASGLPADVPYLGTISAFQPGPSDSLLVAIGTPATRRRIVESLRGRGASFATLIHPTAVVARTAKLLPGTILCPLSLVSAGAVLDEFVIVNVASSVGHDVIVGAYATLSAHVDLTGGVHLGDEVLVGSGARVLPGISVGARAVLGAGAVVVRSVPQDTTVYAAPAKRL
jgi:sugar O-acyltransferase (sialic acid O-acetyltransferase NeuD family)